jgi:acetyl esterase/lipase
MRERIMTTYVARLGVAGPAWLMLVCLMLAAAAPGVLGQASELEDDGGPSGPIALPQGARVERDVAYGPDARQRFDVYLPRHAAAAPIVLMVHGGGWRIGDKAMVRVVANKAAHWLPKGIIFVSTNYRLTPAADPLRQADDVASALAAAQAKAPSWGGDPARVVLMGHSAGAHLVALLAADPAIAARQGARPWLGTIPLDSAALDVVQIMEGRHLRLYDNAFKSDPAFWRAASPFHRLTGTPRPLLIVCSSRRRDACPPARAFAAKATAAGGRATVLPMDLSHREINETLGLPGAYTAAVDAFLRTLGLP